LLIFRAKWSDYWIVLCYIILIFEQKRDFLLMTFRTSTHVALSRDDKFTMYIYWDIVILFSRTRKIFEYLSDLVYHISSRINNKGWETVREVRVLIISDKSMHIDTKEYIVCPVYFSLKNEGNFSIRWNSFFYHILGWTFWNRDQIFIYRFIIYE